MSENSDTISQGEEIAQTEPKPLRYPPYPGYSYHEPGRPVSKYSARYAHQSLENTNMRTNESDDNPSNSSSPASGSPNKETAPLVDDKETATELDIMENNSENDTLSGSRPFSPKDEQSKNLAEQDDIQIIDQKIDQQDSVDTCKVESSINKYNNDRDQNTEKKDTQKFEVEKTIPWLRMIPEDKNLSRQMFLYLTHTELKSKIEDIQKKETQACNRQCWDEALRLRDMKNRLELIREKRMYHTENVDLDEESRKCGFANIDKREAELLQREKVCTDSTMYSEDAKAMWKKWVHEDEQSTIKDALMQREDLMNRLEEEWQRLAIHEKEKISKSYQIVMNDSTLQDLPKLAAAVHG